MPNTQTEQFIEQDYAAPELMQDARQYAMLTIEDSSFAVFVLEQEGGKEYDVVGVAKDCTNLCAFVTRYDTRADALCGASLALLNEYDDCIAAQEALQAVLKRLKN